MEGSGADLASRSKLVILLRTWDSMYGMVSVSQIHLDNSTVV